jgi:hypothetical protein
VVTYNPAYWRERAEEARTAAEAMTTAEAKRQLLTIAAAYALLAEHAERTAATEHRIVGSFSCFRLTGAARRNHGSRPARCTPAG